MCRVERCGREKEEEEEREREIRRERETKANSTKHTTWHNDFLCELSRTNAKGKALRAYMKRDRRLVRASLLEMPCGSRLFQC